MASLQCTMSVAAQRSSTAAAKPTPSRIALYKNMRFSAFVPGSKLAPASAGRSLRTKASMVETSIPADYATYETLIVMRPDMSDEERDMELAKFEAFLKKEAARRINVSVRGRQRLAYPIKGFTEGIYVLYSFAAASKVAQDVQRNLSTPEAGSELNILRHMTIRV